MKKCTKCGVEKPLSEYHKKTKSKDGLDYSCKSCKRGLDRAYRMLPENTVKNRKRALAWNKNNPEKRKVIVKRENYKKRYGLSLEDKQLMIDAQQGKCQICRDSLINTDNAHVDHCHSTNIIRGILCRKCNLGLGHFKDNTDILKSAVKYLKKYSVNSAEK